MTDEQDTTPDPADVLIELRSARFAFGLRCPRCHGRRIHRWGSFRARQRYRCLHCRRTFSDLTGTPCHYAKRLHLLPEYATCLREGLSVRRAASRVGIHPTTAFRWRHRLLDSLRVRDRERLEGWSEFAIVYFGHSEKGARTLRRSPRIRGRRRGSPRLDRVPAVLGCDRIGNAISIALDPVGPGRAAAPKIDAAMGHLVSPDIVATSALGRLGPIGGLARLRGITYRESIRPGPRTKVRLAHEETIADYRARLLDWMRRFRGVATRYLPNYLVWHRGVDSDVRRGIARTVLRWRVDLEAG